MDQVVTNLRLSTFNCKHFRDRGPKFDFLCNLMSINDFLFLQEHCLFDSHLHKLKRLGDSVDIIGKSAMDESVPLEGRPYGGCAIAYKTSLCAAINEVPCDNKRMCALTANLSDTCRLLLINVYMPCDNRRRDGNFQSFIDVLGEVDRIIQAANPTIVYMGGDLNTDLNRSSPHAEYLRSFMVANDMITCIDHVNANVPYTYIGPNCTSRIDHILLPAAFSPYVLSCNIVDNHLISDHVPVSCEMKVDLNHFIVKDRSHVIKTAWYKASDEQVCEYRTRLDEYLSDIVIDNDLAECHNIHCARHTEALCVLYHNVLDACLRAAECIPTCGVPDNSRPNFTLKAIPGWDEFVEPLHKEALFWHKHWKDCGKPHTGLEAELHRITRARYHKAIRGVIRDHDSIVMERMANAILDSNHRDLWREVKKIKGRNNTVSANVDGFTTDSDIAAVFSRKYDNLYNSVPYSTDELQQIMYKIDDRLSSPAQQSYRVEFCDVRKAIAKLKHGKSDGQEGLNSDHIINGTEKLFQYLTSIFNAMLVHGISPSSMLQGTMVPIPKGRGKMLGCSDNYRAITLSSIVSKVFDWVILMKEDMSLRSSDLQFGFKEHTSTTHCTFAFNEVISYYNSKGSDVYVLLLDATKAFDRVNFCKLFTKLLDRDLSPLLLRLLVFMYTNQTLQVRWSSFVGDTFNACNGVKQGGVLSPILFSVYMDDLYNRLQGSGVGCHVGNHFAGALGYADDNGLLAPTLKGLQTMAYICDEYAEEHDVIFNGSKSQFLIFRAKAGQYTKRSIDVGRSTVENCDICVHLCHNLSAIDKGYCASKALCHFWRSFNIFRADFGHLSSDIQCKLFMSYCCSYYGAPLWDLESNIFKRICAAWRKALRTIWKISPMSHCDLVALLSNNKPLEVNIKQRFSKFAENIYKYGSNSLIAIADAALQNPNSVFCNNFNNVMGHNNFDFTNTRYKLYHDWTESVSDDIMARVNVLKEMLSVRNGDAICPGFHNDEVNIIIEDICIH